METHHKQVKLTAAELSYLWRSYIGDSMAVCVFSYFLENVDDNEVKSTVTQALDLSLKNVEEIKEIFIKENIQIPQGFTKEDVNLKAKRLFSDTFYLNYIKQMTKGGLANNARVLPTLFRDDIRLFYSKSLNSSIDLHNEVTDLLLKKGLAVRPSFIPYPQSLEFVNKHSFIFEGLGKRPLSGIEVTQLFSNIQTNHFGSSLATAFVQVTKAKKVKNFISRGKDISIKHIKIFGEYLANESLPIPMSYEQEISDSTESPFSDKLIMYHFSLMIYEGISNYGVSISESQRSDLVVDYSRLLTEVIKFSEDGFNILIKNEWLEQPPLASDREDLAREK